MEYVNELSDTVLMLGFIFTAFGTVIVIAAILWEN